MAKKFYTNVDLTFLELLNLRFQLLGSDPATPQTGYGHFSTVTDSLMIRNGAGVYISADASKVPDGYIPNVKLATNPLARANHTGNQLAATISDFDSQVRTSRLDQFAVPTASVSFNGQKITSLGTPTANSDAATKAYVDNLVQSSAAGIDSKASVRAVAITNIALTGTQTIDGVALIAGDSVLVTGQTTGSQNGVYLVAAGAWTRRTDADDNGEITPGAFWFVEEGTARGKTQWRAENTGNIVIGTTTISINQFGAANVYSAGNGIDVTGTVISAKVVANGGINAGAGGLSIDTSIVARKYASDIGDGTATQIDVTHNLNTKDVIVNIYRSTTPWDTVECDVERISVNAVRIRMAVAPTAAQYRVTVQG